MELRRGCSVDRSDISSLDVTLPAQLRLPDSLFSDTGHVVLPIIYHVGYWHCSEHFFVGADPTQIGQIWWLKLRQHESSRRTRPLAMERQWLTASVFCVEAGVRAAAECVARSRSEETQECACRLLRSLAEGNPKFHTQVYRGFIALLPSSSAKAQHMAAQSLRIIQVGRPTLYSLQVMSSIGLHYALCIMLYTNNTLLTLSAAVSHHE